MTALAGPATRLVRSPDQATNGGPFLRAMVRERDQPAGERPRTASSAVSRRSLVRVADQIGQMAFR